MENKILAEMKQKIEELRQAEQNRSSDMPLSIQMESDLYDFSLEEKSITLSFPVIQKELNPNGAMMGGLITAALDITYGILVYSLSGGGTIPPTITMTANFINPIFFEDTLLITAKIESWGKRIINMSAFGVSKNTGKKIITSTTSFVSTEAFKK